MKAWFKFEQHSLAKHTFSLSYLLPLSISKSNFRRNEKKKSAKFMVIWQTNYSTYKKTKNKTHSRPPEGFYFDELVGKFCCLSGHYYFHSPHVLNTFHTYLFYFPHDALTRPFCQPPASHRSHYCTSTLHISTVLSLYGKKSLNELHFLDALNVLMPINVQYLLPFFLNVWYLVLSCQRTENQDKFLICKNEETRLMMNLRRRPHASHPLFAAPQTCILNPA